jgi:hypothetical protein
MFHQNEGIKSRKTQIIKFHLYEAVTSSKIQRQKVEWVRRRGNMGVVVH